MTRPPLLRPGFRPQVNGFLILSLLFAGVATVATTDCWRRCYAGQATCAEPAEGAGQGVNAEKTAADPTPPWQNLLDGKSLAGWKEVQFGGEGEVYVEKGELWLDMGDTLTGVTYQGKPPKTNYEIQLQAKRAGGIDFFCGLTFPVDDSYCSFIVGGWAGSVVGLSSIDGRDASDNDTTSFMSFKDKQWYDIRVRVSDSHIQAWIDNKQVVNQDIRGKRIGTRAEVNLNQPLGLCTWQTKAAVRNLRLRTLTPAEVKAIVDSSKKADKEKRAKERP